MTAQQEAVLLQQLIANNQNQEAAERLAQWFAGKNAGQQDAALLLLNRISSLEHNVLTGVIAQADADLERNRITKALLDLSKQLDSAPGLPDSGKRRIKAWLIAGIVMLLAGLAIWLSQRDRVPADPAAFDLTVHLYGPGGEADLIRAGKIKLVLGDHHVPPQDINSNGQATFDQIPGTYFRQPVRLVPVDLRYKVTAQSARTAAESRSIGFQLAPLPDTTLVRGSVFLPGAGNRPATGAQLDFNAGQAQGLSDANGHFQVPLPLAAGSTVQVMITYQGRNRYNRQITIATGQPLQITLNP